MSKNRSITNLAFNKATFIKFSEGIAKKYSYDIAVLMAIFMELEEYFESKGNTRKFLEISKGFFYCMSKYVEERNGMTYNRMRRAVIQMEELKLIETKKWAKNWKLYKINHNTLSTILLTISLENLDKKGSRGEMFESKLKELESLVEKLG